MFETTRNNKLFCNRHCKTIYHNSCKIYDPEKSRLNYLKNRDKTSKHYKIIRQKYPERALLSGAKVRAKRYNLDFNIDLLDIKVPKKCPILKIPIILGKRIHCKNSPTLDRIDNRKGYIKGNVLVISYKANTMKSNATPKQLRKLSKWVFKNKSIL